MPILTDRQRIELAIPAYPLYALAAAPGTFTPADPALAAKAEADIAVLCANLRVACLEPLVDLVPKKRDAIVRRLQRVSSEVIADWRTQPALCLMVTLWYFLRDLTDREVLILWEGSAMERATRQLLPMFAYGFDEGQGDGRAQLQAGELLMRLQADGWYR